MERRFIKHLHYRILTQGAALSPELVAQVEKDYIELMDLILHGIAAGEKH